MKTNLFNSTKLFFLFCALFLGNLAFAQSETFAKVEVKSPINQLIENEISHKIPVITAIQLTNLQKSDKTVTVLDTRIQEAYDLARIKDARYLGTEFTVEKIWMLNRNAPVVVYGEDAEVSQSIGQQLLEKGFKNVSFLNGSLTDLEEEGIVVEGDVVKSDRKSAKHNRRK